MYQPAVTGLLSIVILFSLQFGVSQADASTVEKVRGAMAIVNFDGGETPAAGDKFFALENGKKRAILEVVQFKNGKAKVKIAKGKAKEGMTVASVGTAGKANTPGDQDAAAADSAEEGGKKKKSRSVGGATLLHDMTFGLVGGYSMDSQSVTIAGSSAQSMTGTGFSAKGFIDIPVTNSLALYSRVGAEQFNVQSGVFKSEIMYAAADLLLKWSFTNGTFVPFLMGGLGLHFPISKNSNILDINRISSTTVFYGGGGLNWVMGSSTYFQLTGEYGMFPPSNDVSTSFIAARFGLGFRF